MLHRQSTYRFYYSIVFPQKQIKSGRPRAGPFRLPTALFGRRLLFMKRIRVLAGLTALALAASLAGCGGAASAPAPTETPAA